MENLVNQLSTSSVSIYSDIDIEKMSSDEVWSHTQLITAASSSTPTSVHRTSPKRKRSHHRCKSWFKTRTSQCRPRFKPSKRHPHAFSVSRKHTIKPQNTLSSPSEFS